MHQLIIELTNRLEKIQEEAGAITISRDQIQECVLASLEANVRFMRFEVLMPPSAQAEAQRNLKLIAGRDVLEAIVDDQELRLERSKMVTVPEQGVFEHRRAVEVTVGLLRLNPRPILSAAQPDPPSSSEDPPAASP